MSLRKTFHVDDGYQGILGQSPAMQRLFELIENVALSDAPVMIQGQSGTGKELVARAIHDVSLRRSKPFVKVNCAALNENLLESELFGHVKGAYTGADRSRAGRFETAHEGTIFLDEIGDIPLKTQVKLLRVLEEKEIERVGDHKSIPVDVRIISATNRDLDALIAQGVFREDLFFRINVFPLRCPALSERKEDIPMIVQNFIEQNMKKSGKKILGLTSEAMEKLMVYSWPGNVRELRNAIEYAFVLCSGGWIEAGHLPVKIVHPETRASKNSPGASGKFAGAGTVDPNPSPGQRQSVRSRANSGSQPGDDMEAHPEIRDRCSLGDILSVTSMMSTMAAMMSPSWRMTGKDIRRKPACRPSVDFRCGFVNQAVLQGQHHRQSGQGPFACIVSIDVVAFGFLRSFEYGKPVVHGLVGADFFHVRTDQCHSDIQMIHDGSKPVFKLLQGIGLYFW